MAYEWNFSILTGYLPLLAEGGLNTLKLVGSSLCFAVPVGMLLGIIRQQGVPVLSTIAVAYIEFFRTSVMLVLMCWCYYALPILIGINLDTFLAVTIAIGLQTSAFMAELVRGGIQSISRGQWEAARALGMPMRVSMSYIILPQALRRMLPVFFLLLIEVMKNTALAGVVTYPELFYNASTVSTITYRPLETFTVIGLIYLTVIFCMSQLAQVLETRLALSER